MNSGNKNQHSRVSEMIKNNVPGIIRKSFTETMGFYQAQRVRSEWAQRVGTDIPGKKNNWRRKQRRLLKQRGHLYSQGCFGNTCSQKIWREECGALSYQL